MGHISHLKKKQFPSNKKIMRKTIMLRRKIWHGNALSIQEVNIYLLLSKEKIKSSNLKKLESR